VDNTGDAHEDLVFQFTFSGPAGHQRVRLQGPAAPNEVGTSNTLLTGQRELQGFTGETLGSADGIQLFAGPRDDPFFIDLEAFFRVLPDRKPEAGPLSQITQGPLTFRPPGTAVDFVRGINDLAIVVERPPEVRGVGHDEPRPQCALSARPSLPPIEEPILCGTRSNGPGALSLCSPWRLWRAATIVAPAM
jgi:hypothetical protein